MSVGAPALSNEIAEDYKNSLEDLTANSRWEISNLTVIAKENTANAFAISRVLENHIKNTLPDQKLPALYVLDSVVKNVGTPYTLFLGRNLYGIFMSAYSAVSNTVRRKLDEMLKTWKEPVPGSLDPRPVFPGDIIRPIENALIKARTAAVQQQQQQQVQTQREMMRTRPMATPNPHWRGTPTPPQTNGQYYPPPPQSFAQHNGPSAQYQPRPPYPPQPQFPPQQQIPQQYQQSYQQPASYPQIAPSPQTLDPLHRDIAVLVARFRTEFAASPYDESLRGRLQALVALQDILRKQQLSPHELQDVRDQVARLSAEPARAPAPQQYVPIQHALHQQPRPLHQLPPQVSTPQSTDLQALLSSRNLAGIIANAQRTPSTTPVTQAPVSHSQQMPAARLPGPPAPSSDLLAMLRANGMLAGGSNTPMNGSLGSLLSPSPTSTPQITPADSNSPELINDVELTSVSLKRPRPHLISILYEARPNQCSTCGRRFLATPEGREKKARHLDWHFRTNQRLVDSAKRGQSRSWYVDELEWIKSRDDPEEVLITDAPSSATKAALAASLAAADPKNKHIPVPSDPALTKLPCPICQEKFDTVWNDEAQDFVWMDAIKIGSRVYHASCHAEVKKDGGITPLRNSTPDSVLGKRKVGGLDLNASNAKAPKT